MEQMVQEYMRTREGIMKRIRQLNRQIGQPRLKTMQRESLIARRDLLKTESLEMLHVIHELEEHLKGAERNAEGHHTSLGVQRVVHHRTMRKTG